MHVQVPPVHVKPGAHDLPQAPQLLSSLFRSLQAPSQQAGDVPVHVVPHLPQFVMSVWWSMSRPPQQLCELLHLIPQAPQLLQSDGRLLHLPLQHTAPLPKHVLPQPPQLKMSVCSSTQAPPQHDWPGRHAATSLQLVPHVLGCDRTMQVLLQHVSAPPASQVRKSEQVPHSPAKSRHLPAQHRVCSGQGRGSCHWPSTPQVSIDCSETQCHWPAAHAAASKPASNAPVSSAPVSRAASALPSIAWVWSKGVRLHVARSSTHATSPPYGRIGAL
jgi:hypothetical protein